MDLGNKPRDIHILITGVPMSGKTTMANELAIALKTKFIEVKHGPEPAAYIGERMNRYKDHQEKLDFLKKDFKGERQ